MLGALGDAALTAELDRPGARPAAGWRGALDAGGGLVRYGPRRGTGGLAQQGWRDAIAPVEHHPEGAGIVRAGRHRAGARRWPTPTARRRRSPRSTRSRRLDPARRLGAPAPPALRSLLARWAPT